MAWAQKLVASPKVAWALRMARKMSFKAALSSGRAPRVLIALRIWRLSDSIALVYTGAILIAFGWALAVAGTLSLAYAFMVVGFLAIKTAREERWLREEVRGYSNTSDAYAG